MRKHLTDEQFKLYKLIWDRFVASQMAPAVYDQTSVEIEAKPQRRSPRYPTLTPQSERQGAQVFAAGSSNTARASRATTASSRWPGKKRARRRSADGGNGQAKADDGNGAGGNGAAPSFEDSDDGTLPELAEGEELDIVSPPGVRRRAEVHAAAAALQRRLAGARAREARHRAAEHVRRDHQQGAGARLRREAASGGQMKATDLGKLVVDGLVSTELDFMDPSFTAKMEEDLDEVEGGKLERVELLTRFYERFRKTLERAKKQKRWTPQPEPTEHKCAECGGVCSSAGARTAGSWAASATRTASTRAISARTATAPAELRATDIKCDKCGRTMVIRTGRYGEFLSCSGYPECKNAKPVPLGVPCPKCAGDIIEIRSKKRGGKPFYGCSRLPGCATSGAGRSRSTSRVRAVQHPFLTIAGGKQGPRLVCPRGKECGYTRPLEEPAPQPAAAPARARGARSRRAIRKIASHPDRRRVARSARPEPCHRKASRFVSTAVTVLGAGLAGCEAALQLAERGVSVRLIEQKPKARTPAQVSDRFCELVCSQQLSRRGISRTRSACSRKRCGGSARS